MPVGFDLEIRHTHIDSAPAIVDEAWVCRAITTPYAFLTEACPSVP